uniref:Uncharacterized protein n=1 Tax=Anguilla anguilla TaxID=7936 RepID=A0A0E9S4G7_ANGAN
MFGGGTDSLVWVSRAALSVCAAFSSGTLLY